MTPVLHEHPFAAYCWKALIAFYERDVRFERVFVGGAEDRARLAELWPVGSIPVLVDGDRVLGESTAIVEHVTPALVPGLDARLWDRVIDGQVMTPMQKIVADSLRPDGLARPLRRRRGPRHARPRLRAARRPPHGGLARRPGVHRRRLRGRAGALLRVRRAPLGRGHAPAR